MFHLQILPTLLRASRKGPKRLELYPLKLPFEARAAPAYPAVSTDSFVPGT